MEAKYKRAAAKGSNTLQPSIAFRFKPTEFQPFRLSLESYSPSPQIK